MKAPNYPERFFLRVEIAPDGQERLPLDRVLDRRVLDRMVCLEKG